MDLSQLIQNFDIGGRLVTVMPTGNGNVNDTYLAIFRNTFEEYQVIMQRINSKVFPDPSLIMKNLREVTAHVHAKLDKDSGRADRVWQMPQIVKTRDGNDFFIDDEGAVWRVITKIPSATAFDETQSLEHARECGTVLGYFHWLLSDIEENKIADPLPGFHITPLYLSRYDEVIENVPEAKERLFSSMEARRMSAFVEKRREFSTVLQKALLCGELEKRMMHGDPKVNNIMIDDFTGKGSAMIDLDTISPGLVHYDFGDAIRSICNPAGEEEPDLRKVVLDFELCEAFCSGYLEQAEMFMSDIDKVYLFDSVRLITFELGLRFFRDYLAGNVYFKTTYSDQNLHRARVQFKLCESIEVRENMMRKLFCG
ncbi:MAG: aminoglycoside phosphotransferase family protein [Kiritimatiellae bacterium]|nr:aminoglycoside phosphotransferase family protein [Kiritimatiellia bacterium]